MKRIVIALALAACSRHEESSTSLTSATIDASTRPLVEMAQRWNRALSNRDVTLVPSVYGAQVELWGVPLRNDQVVAIQKVAFDDDQSFTQTIDQVRVEGSRVELRRKWIRFGTTYTGHAWLEGSKVNGRWVVTKEGDDASDARARSQEKPKKESCESVAMLVALSTMEAGELVKGPPDRITTRIAAAPPSYPAYAIALTTLATGAPTTAAWYDVVPCRMYAPGPNVRPTTKACVTPGNVPGVVTDALSGRVLTADPGLLDQMNRCPEK